MQRLTVIFGDSGINWAFLFRQKETAEACVASHKASPNTTWVIADDFGQHGEIQAPQLKAFMLEDMDLSRMAAVEAGLHQARVQAKAQEMAKADPILRTAMRQQSPGVLTPNFPQ